MSLRAKVSAVAVTAAACMLLAPTAMASSRGAVQVTGKQLKSALLPASDFLPGYAAAGELDSGRALQHGSVYKLPSMSCRNFWPALAVTYIAPGFGETAYAADEVDSKSDTVSVFELFEQEVDQFASTHAASSFFSQLSAKYRSCPSFSESDTRGGTLRWKVRSRSTQHVGGHQALQLVETQSDSTVSGPPLVIDVLWTTDGTDVYMVSSELLSVSSAQPTLSSLTFKLISRVRALR